MTHGTGSSRHPTHMHRLDNGLTVLVREDHSAPVVAVVTRVGTGYLDEPDELVGISHVVEHMLFRGSSRRAAGDMAREVRAAGGAMNAGTLYEATTYQMVLPSSALALGLELQSDALGSPAFHEEELRRELLVIMQEARGKWDNPDAVASELLFRAMFDVHRLRRWRIGTEAGLAKITRNDVVAFHQAMYCPSNMIVVISGDVAPRRALQLADRYFGALPADSPSRSLSSPAEPERVGLRVRGSTVEGVTKTRIDWGWRTPGALHPSTPAVELLAVVLGQGRASRLFRGVREAGGATEIEALHYVLADLGVLAISAHVPPSNQVRAAESIWSEVEALRRGGVLHREVERAKGVLDARALRRTETAVGQARFLAEWQALGDWRLGERHRQSLSTVTPDDVSRVAHEYVSLDRATVVVHYPGGAHEWALERLEQAVREATPMSREPAAPDEERAGRPRHPRPEPGSEAGLHVGEEHGIHLFDLPGGVRLAVKPRRSVTLVSAGIFFRGGIAFERAEEAGITRFMCRASLQGTETRAGERLAVETEALGAVLDASVLSDDIVRWSLSLPSRHFESGLALLADVVLSPSFPSAALERERRAGLQALARVRGDVFRYPLHLFLRGAFPDHPYGFSIDAKQVALCRFTRDEVLRWHRREVLRAKPCVVVVGDVEPTHAATLVARHLSPLQAPESRPEPMSPAWPRGPRDEVEIRAGK